jgi:hypothetical protein
MSSVNISCRCLFVIAACLQTPINLKFDSVQSFFLVSCIPQYLICVFSGHANCPVKQFIFPMYHRSTLEHVRSLIRSGVRAAFCFTAAYGSAATLVEIRSPIGHLWLSLPGAINIFRTISLKLIFCLLATKAYSAFPVFIVIAPLFAQSSHLSNTCGCLLQLCLMYIHNKFVHSVYVLLFFSYLGLIAIITRIQHKTYRYLTTCAFSRKVRKMFLEFKLSVLFLNICTIYTEFYFFSYATYLMDTAPWLLESAGAFLILRQPGLVRISDALLHSTPLLTCSCP